MSDDNTLISGAFRQTRWSLVQQATDAAHPQTFSALSELCQIYWEPLYYFARRTGLSPSDAEDATQDYFLQLLE
jgi:RNA polymerase sigma-70 factor (ECF subfamily)